MRLWVEDEVAACGFHQLHIAVQIAWICLKVFVGAELDWVYKHRYHGAVVLAN